MTLQIIGIPQSNFVRAVRMVAEEKGVKYELTDTAPHAEEIKAISPTGKVPGMLHAGFELSESQAIARYIDTNFDGPPLIPVDTQDAAKVNQWVSIIATEVDQLLMRNYVVEYVFHKDEKGNVIRTKIDRALRRFPTMFKMIENSISGGYCGTDSFSMADCFITPILNATIMFPEGQEAIDHSAPIKNYFLRMCERQSFKNTGQ